MGCASSTTRGLIGGGVITPARVNTIEFVTIASDGNSSDFGDLLDDREHTGATSNGIRAIWAGGVSPYRNSIEFVTIASEGNATDFGEISHARRFMGGSATQTRGFIMPGFGTDTTFNRIESVTIASAGNSVDFGDISYGKAGYAYALSSTTRGIIAGGLHYNPPSPATYNSISFVTISTTGDTTDFGDLTTARQSMASMSSGTRGVIAGGYEGAVSVALNEMQYITCATPGNGTDFGDLVGDTFFCGGVSSTTRGVWGGGATPTKTNICL